MYVQGILTKEQQERINSSSVALEASNVSKLTPAETKLASELAGEEGFFNTLESEPSRDDEGELGR